METSFADACRTRTSPMIGMWVASGSPVSAEICADSDLDWLLLDAEHAPNDFSSILAQLRATAAYDTHVVVRPPSGDPVLIKRLLDIGAHSLLVPMVESADQAADLVRATRYPPEGYRGVGTAFARATRWNRDDSYLATASDRVSLMVQVESAPGLNALDEILAVDGIDGVFIGPADLAGSLGHLGRPQEAEVLEVIDDAVDTIVGSGKLAGSSSFSEPRVGQLLARGCRFMLVGADVTLLAQGSDRLAAAYAAASNPRET